MSEAIWLQLGIGGAALLVLHLTLTKTMPNALKPITDGLGQMSHAIDRLAEAHGKLAERLARMEGKFDFAHDLTPVDSPIPIRTYPDRPPPKPTPTPTAPKPTPTAAATYALHRLKPK